MISAEESAKNYFKYKKRIEDLCKKSGKWETGVELLCATKTVSGERINEIRSLTGLDLIGENRVQELLEKYDVLDKEGLRIHFIGKLQSNKVKYIIDKVDMIESLDSLSLAAEIDRQARKHGIVMDVLVEINIGREKEKSGIMPEETEVGPQTTTVPPVGLTVFIAVLRLPRGEEADLPVPDPPSFT